MIETLFLFLLIIFNGFLAMAELAIVSARKSKLAQMADQGNKNSQLALSLARSP